MQVSIVLEPVLAQFYSQIAHTCGKELHQVLEDALFRLAGELSLESLRCSQMPKNIPL